MPYFKTILSNFLTPLDDSTARWMPNGAMLIMQESEGVPWRITDIIGIEEGKHNKAMKQLLFDHKGPIIDRLDCVCMPGMVDLHFHWVQDAVREMPKDSLLTWLKNHTWPYEAKFSDPNFCREKALEFSRELLRRGTLGGACYAALYPESVEEAFQNFKGYFKIGNPLMTENSPAYLSHSEEEAIASIEYLSEKFKSDYALTPRFAPTVSPSFMKKAKSALKADHHFIQTHLSETREECQYVLDLYRKFPKFEDVHSYTEIYDRMKLLGSKTIMGHGIYLEEKEWRLLGETQTAIAHCPTSNAPLTEGGLGSGTFDFEKANSYNVPWALGSDIGAGPFLSMFDVMASFIRQQIAVGRDVSATQAFYRATLAGAKILGISDKVGHLHPGGEASFCFWPLNSSLGNISPEELLGNFLFFSPDINERKRLDLIRPREVYLNGESVLTL